MSTGYTLILAAFSLSMLVMTLVWLRQTITKNAGIVDAWWSYNFSLIALVYAIWGNGDSLIRVIMVVMVLVWSFRLGTHLLLRNTGHTAEDQRYADMRTAYGENQRFRMWLLFMYQAVSNVLLSLPFLLAALAPERFLSVYQYLGIILWVVAFTGESLADRQLKRFKADPANHGKVCQAGLWNYSRHPNYFFEWMIWLSYSVFVIDLPWGWSALACPVIMYLLLNKVTGIPLLEELSLKSKGDVFREYQQTTSAFFPWFKRRLK